MLHTFLTFIFVALALATIIILSLTISATQAYMYGNDRKRMALSIIIGIATLSVLVFLTLCLRNTLRYNPMYIEEEALIELRKEERRALRRLNATEYRHVVDSVKASMRERNAARPDTTTNRNHEPNASH